MLKTMMNFELPWTWIAFGLLVIGGLVFAYDKYKKNAPDAGSPKATVSVSSDGFSLAMVLSWIVALFTRIFHKTPSEEVIQLRAELARLREEMRELWDRLRSSPTTSPPAPPAPAAPAPAPVISGVPGFQGSQVGYQGATSTADASPESDPVLTVGQRLKRIEKLLSHLVTKAK